MNSYQNWTRSYGMGGTIHDTLRSTLLDCKVDQTAPKGPFSVLVIAADGELLRRAPRTYLTPGAARKAAVRMANGVLRQDKALFRGVL